MLMIQIWMLRNSFFMFFRLLSVLYVTKYDFWVAHDVDLWKFRCYQTMLLNIENRLVERLNRKSKNELIFMSRTSTLPPCIWMYAQHTAFLTAVAEIVFDDLFAALLVSFNYFFTSWPEHIAVTVNFIFNLNCLAGTYLCHRWFNLFSFWLLPIRHTRFDY